MLLGRGHERDLQLGRVACARPGPAARHARATGTSGPSASGTTTSPSQRAISVAIVVSAENGTVPVTASMSTRPSAYTSALPSTLWPCACSGAAYRAVPSNIPCGSVHAASAMARARPKSPMRSRPSSPKRRLAGLMSRCTRPCRWAYSRPRAVSRPISNACDGRQAVAGVEHRPEAAAAEVLAHEVRDALVGARVVDVHDVGVVERGRGLGLGPEALEEGRVVGHSLVEHLDRDAPPQLRVVGEVDATPRHRCPVGRRCDIGSRGRGRRGRSGATASRARDYRRSPSDPLGDPSSMPVGGSSSGTVRMRACPHGCAASSSSPRWWSPARSRSGRTTTA